MAWQYFTPYLMCPAEKLQYIPDLLLPGTQFTDNQYSALYDLLRRNPAAPLDLVSLVALDFSDDERSRLLRQVSKSPPIFEAAENIGAAYISEHLSGLFSVHLMPPSRYFFKQINPKDQ